MEERKGVSCVQKSHEPCLTIYNRSNGIFGVVVGSPFKTKCFDPFQNLLTNVTFGFSYR